MRPNTAKLRAMIKFENIRVVQYGASIAAHWETTEARFHVYLDHSDKYKPIGPIYKNSLADYKQPGYFDTRKLDATKKANAWIIEEIMRVVTDGCMIANAMIEYDAKQAAERMAQDRVIDTNRRVSDIVAHIAEILERDGDQSEILFNHMQLRALLAFHRSNHG